MRRVEGEIFVVDNNSTDGSKDFFSGSFPEVHFIWNTFNEGFAKANNVALRLVSGDYILFLNPDTIIPEDCIEKCISFIQAHNNAIACGVKMIDGSGKFLQESKRSFPSPMTSLYKLSGLAYIFPRSKVFSKYHLGYLRNDANHQVDVLAGAFMMIPKKIIDKVGGFDESFFMYGEDIDLSYRIQRAGYKNYYFAESTIIHFKGESTKRGSLNYVKMFYKAMNVFVKKHYGGTKAGLFIFFIQSAIILRAGLAAAGRFLKWIGLPVIDAAIIFFSFKIIKLFWNHYIKSDVNYSPNLLSIAFPVFTLLFLTASFFAGLYDNGYKQSRLNKSTAISILVVLSAYSLLPENLRFSRGILLFGSLLAFIFMTITRWMLVTWQIVESAKETTESQVVIAGTLQEFNEVNKLMEAANMQKRIAGRISTEEQDEQKITGSFKNIFNVIQSLAVKEIIFCNGHLSLKKIIATMSALPAHIKVKLYFPGMSTIIGSDDKNDTGYYISGDKQFKLASPVSRRNKMLTDIITALLLIITFPVHLLAKKRPLIFFKKAFDVLLLKKTFIGYALPENDLPFLKPGVLTTTGLPGNMNILNDESLQEIDTSYATNFDAFKDVRMIWAGYKFLS